MFGGLGMPIPYLSNKPGPGRPGWGPAGSYDFQFEVIGDVTIEAFPNTTGQSFTIKWQDGSTTQTSGSSTINSPIGAGAGIISINNELDNTYADEFKIVNGKNNVTKVISWGRNPWSNVFEAFKDCVNLTDISTTSFLASGQGPSNNQGCYMTKMFDGCTSLLEVDIRNWDLTAGVSWKGGSPFINLVNLEKIDATGLKIKFQDNASYARSWFIGVGSATTNGCEFKLSGLDYSSTTNTGMVIDGIFGSVKFKDGSNLSNWKFPSYANSTYSQWFSSARISGTLDMSGWTTFNGSSLESMFYRFNQHLTAADGSKINMSNLGLTYATSFYRMFWECEISEIIGLNTWGATSGAAVNLNSMFKSANFMRINPSDNFSSAFTSSLNVGDLRDMCYTFSSGLANADVGASPSFVGADFSSMTNSFRFMFRGAKIISSPDFSTCTFSASNPMNFANIFYTTTITDTNNHFILNNQNLAISYISQAFWQTSIRRVTIGDNVDLSNLVTIDYMSYQAGFDTGGLTLPSNANYSSLIVIGQYAFQNNALSTCQVDTFIRQNWATNLNTGLTCDLENNKITAAPSIARSNAASLSSVRTWNITLGSPDTPLPFAYPSYFVDRDVYSNITPSSFPAGSTFSSTNAGMTINQNTGVISWASNFSGESIIRCTYPDGCYNEVNMLVGVPMVYKVTVGDSNYGNGDLGFQVKSIGDYRTQSVAIDLGDGTTVSGVDGINHTYATAGDYDISIFGNFDPWFYNLSNDANKLREVSKWGESNHSLGGQYTSSGFSQRGAFNGCNNMDITATDACVFLPGRSLLYAFVYCYNLTNSNGSMNTWDVSEVTDFGTMFYNVYSKQFPIDQWVFGTLADTGGVSLNGMFQNTSFNTDISTRVRPDGQLAWDTEGVTSMSSIFRTCTSFKQDISNWNIDNVTSLYGFQYPYGQTSVGMDVDMSTKQVTVGTKTYIAWDVKSCTNFAQMFGSNQRHGGAKPRNLINWNTSNATTMSGMFQKARVDPNGPAWNLTPRQVTVGTGVTARTYNAWDVSNVENFSSIFSEAVNINGPNSEVGITRAWINGIEDWDVSGSTGDFSSAFYISNIGTIDLSSWNASIEKGYFFSGGSSLISSFAGLDITNLGTGSNSSWGYWGQNSYKSINASGTTTNYDATLTAWGAQSANIVNSGVYLDFGTSKYSPGNIFQGTQGTNTYQGNSIYGGGKDMEQFVSVGDVVERPPDPNGIFDTYAIVTGFNTWNGSIYLRATTQGNIGPSTYTVMDSDAAKGRVALINAGWTITDGGADIPFASTELIIDVNAGDTFTIFSSGSNNNYSVDWGDGNGFSSTPYTGTSATGPAYATGGEKTIKINKDSSEKINALNFYNQTGTINKIKKISNWGTNAWDSLYRAFRCHDTLADRRVHPDFTVESPTPPNFSNGPNINEMFNRCNVNNNIFTNSQVSNWNVRSLNSLYAVFYNCFGFNEDISGWDTSYITSLDYAFGGCSSLNSDISNWDTSRLTTMHTAFSGCSSLNADLNTKDTGSGLAWDVSKVGGFNAALAGTSMSYNIDKWQIKTTGGVYFQSLFNGCNWPNLTLTPKTVTVGSGAYQKTYLAWDTQKVARMDYMIAGNSFNVDIGKWDTSSVTLIDSFAQNNSVFNNGGQPMNARQVTVGTGATARTYTAWDTSNISSWKQVFKSATSFNQDIGNWDLSGATGNVFRILENASSFNHEVNWALPTGFTPNYAWGWYFFSGTNMSTVNYTNTIVNFANTVYNNSGLYNAPATNMGGGRTFDSNMSGGANFANAWEARSYLTSTVASGGAGWTLSGDTILPLLVPSTSSLSFNGSTEYIDVQASPRALVGNSNAYTISAYVFIEEADIAEENYFIIGAMSGTERWYFRVDDGYVGFAYGSIISSTTSTAITAGQWNHVAVTYNGTNTHKIYVDGGNPKYTSTSSTGQTITTNDAYIGALNNGTDSLHFKGKIDEVMVWNTELAQANIQTLANAVGSGNVVNPEQLSSGLQLWNRMGD